MIRLVADENISWRLKKLPPGWDILPTNEIRANERLSDFNIWQFAKTHNYTILTFDEDFCDLQNLYSYPPKIIWLRTGNTGTQKIADLLTTLKKDINQFLLNDELGIYEVYL